MIGNTILHYNILEKLGQGGMGVVYKAHDTKLDRSVALKFLPSHITVNDTDKERFLQEAKAAAALNHPNVCVIHDIQEYEHQQFIVMEYVKGKTLRQLLSEKKRLEIENAIEFAIQIGEALQEAHDKSIVHRDVKSENIMITAANQVKVMDFGLAKLKGSLKITKSSSTVGTLAYMAPEQIQGGEVDARSDIFSFGVVLYEMLTGQCPFKGDYEASLIYSILNDEPESLQKLVPEVSSELLHVINRALEKEVENRYQSIKDLLIDLRRLKRDSDRVSRESLKEMPVVKSETFGKFKPKGKKLWLGISAAAVLLILIIWFANQWIFQGQQETVATPENSIAVMYFDNRSGEPDLERILVDMLTTNLARYEEIEVISSQHLFDILKLIGKEDVESINKHVATEVATRAGVKTMLMGSIIKIGTKIRINAQISDVTTGSLIGSEQVKGNKIDDIFNMVDELTELIRNRLGITKSSDVDKPVKIMDVTTNSYEAYTYFVRGRDEADKLYWDDARKFLERAIQIDSTFAMAYLELGRTYNQLDISQEKEIAYKKAKVFSHKAPERERLYIEALYAGIIERNQDKRIQIFKQITDKYPKDFKGHYELGYYYRLDKKHYNKAILELKKSVELNPNYGASWNQLGYIHADLGDYMKAIEYFQKYAEVAPGEANPYDSMAEMYLRLGKLDLGIETFKKAFEIKPDWGADWRVAYIYALKEDYTKALKWLDQQIALAQSTGTKAEAYLWKGIYNYYIGNRENSINNLKSAEKLTEKGKNSYWNAFTKWIQGWISYYNGEYGNSKRLFKDQFNYKKQFNNPYDLLFYDFNLGLVKLREGRNKSVKSHLEEMQSLFPKLRLIRKEYANFYLNFLSTEILVAENSIEKAINLYKKSLLWDMPRRMFSWNVIRYNLPFDRDILARAYLNQGDKDGAIIEYERLTTFDPNNKDRRLIFPKHYYRLAKLYEEKGAKEKAIKEYQKFLDIWKNADKDLPELIDAKKRLANLVNQ
jgi:serine/threonine protein kinase/tetratricopeptide (TPR) repeat protein